MLVAVGAFLYFEFMYRRSDDSSSALARLEVELKASLQRQQRLEQGLEQLIDQVNGQSTEIAALGEEIVELKSPGPAAGSSQPPLTPAFAKLPESVGEQVPATNPTSDLEHKMRLVDSESIDRERMERHDRLLQEEDYDPVWAEATRARVIEVFDRLDGSGSRLNGIDCRATRCRVSVLHESQASEREFLRGFPMYISSIFPRAAMSHFSLEGAGVETVIHLSDQPVR
jgi:hypothetical protein